MDIIETRDGIKYTISTVKNAMSDRKNPSYHLIIKNTKEKILMVFKDWFWYQEGWSQGIGRSVHGYYLNMQCYGGVGNGSGTSSPMRPYLDNGHREALKELLEERFYSRRSQEVFNDAKTIMEWGTTHPNIQDRLDG